MKKCFYLLTLLALFACNEEDRYDRSSQDSGFLLNTKSDFVQLKNDTTNLAGVLEISTSEPNINLRWNVTPGCNIDTTVTSLSAVNGKVRLPIKWDKKIGKGSFSPGNMAFDAGVLITAADYSKYVRLLWADRIDSTKVTKAPEFWGEARSIVLPKIESLSVSPVIVYLEPGKQSTYIVNTTSRSSVDMTDFTYDNDVNKINVITSLKGFVNFGGVNYTVEFGPGAIPEEPFVTHILVTLNNQLYKYAHFAYVPELGQEEPYFEYIRCSPQEDEKIPANGADINVIVKTNKRWAIRSGQTVTPSAVGEPSANGEKILTLRVTPNTTTADRVVTITVDTIIGTAVKTLNFTQSAPAKSFKFIEADPDPATRDSLIAAGEPVKVRVETDVRWWVELNNKFLYFEKDKEEGSYAVPKNEEAVVKDIVINVGYTDEVTGNNIVVERLVYKQKTDNSLQFDVFSPGILGESGGIVTAKFIGEYKGRIKIRASWVEDGISDYRESAYFTNKEPQVAIPDNFNSLVARTITFKYKLDDVSEWIDIPGNLNQAGTAVIGTVTPDGTIPVGGGEYLGFFAGQYKGDITFRCTASDGKEGTVPEVLGSISGKVGNVMSLMVPTNNTGKIRNISFEYSSNGVDGWKQISLRQQDAKSTVDADGETTVNGFEDQVEDQENVNVD